jgi:hypothetical protein
VAEPRQRFSPSSRLINRRARNSSCRSSPEKGESHGPQDIATRRRFQTQEIADSQRQKIVGDQAGERRDRSVSIYQPAQGGIGGELRAMYQNPARSRSGTAIRAIRKKSQVDLDDGRRRFRTGQKIREQAAPARTRLGRHPLTSHDPAGEKGRQAASR